MVLLFSDVGSFLITIHLIDQERRFRIETRFSYQNRGESEHNFSQITRLERKQELSKHEIMLKRLVLSRLASYSQHCFDTTL